MLINDDWITALSPSPPFNVLLHDRLLPSSPQCDPPSNYYSGPAPFPNYRQRTLYVIALLATPWWEERSPPPRAYGEGRGIATEVEEHVPRANGGTK